MSDSAHLERSAVTGVILAGGAARRMGGVDKALVPVAGRPMIEHVLAAFRPQVGSLLINANRNQERYAGFGVPVVADDLGGFQGPLAGMASALRAARVPYLATVPCDSPLLPPQLVARLGAALLEQRAELAVARCGGQLQPVFSLLRTGLLDSLLDYLARGERKIDLWFARHRSAVVDFDDQPEAFLNVNTPEQARAIERLLEQPDHAPG